MIQIRRAALIFFAAILTVSCSEKSAPDREKNPSVSEAETETQPDEDMIAEDCVALVRATKIVPARAASADCPGCSVAGTEMLAFRQMKTDSVSCSGGTCTALVTIRAAFKPASGETIAGGLTAWIPPETRNAYLSGNVPSEEQTYRVRITYQRRGETWRAVEFDRAQ